ncbi:MAG: hypothetical protein LBJ12_06395 [Oscillospiraceae bacterium]|jgi:hypothetical protein|nr:hypothetical protein [Oscillospiraceae bacterium]
MLATGNGIAAVCTGNLVQIVRGEAPYERLKGIDRTLIDQPMGLIQFMPHGMNAPGILFLSYESANVYGVFPSRASGQSGPKRGQRKRAAS